MMAPRNRFARLSAVAGGQRGLQVLLLLLSPALAAPYFGSCSAGTLHGTFPTWCDPTANSAHGTTGCAAADPTERAANAEARLVEVQATEVPIIGLANWKALELCSAAPSWSLQYSAACASDADCAADEECRSSPIAPNPQVCGHKTCSSDTDCASWEQCRAATGDAPTRKVCAAAQSCYDVTKPTTDAPTACFCQYDFSTLRAWLLRHVSHTSTTNPSKCSDGRHALLQLAPIFTVERTTPDYLLTTPFDSPGMIIAFTRLWDRLGTLLASDAFKRADSVSDRVLWTISIGNEIDAYLSNAGRMPRLPQGQEALEPSWAGLDGSVQEAWSSYRRFFNNASRYVKGYDITYQAASFTIPLPNTSDRTFPRSVGVTTRFGLDRGQTYRDGGSTVKDEVCGPGSLGVNSIAEPCTYRSWGSKELGPALVQVELSSSDQDAVVQEFLRIHKTADLWIYTRYPQPRGADPAQTTTAAVQDALTAGLSSDFWDMSVVSVLGGQLLQSYTMPIALQEFGYPSSWDPTGSPPNYWSDNIADQQGVLITAAFRALANQRAMWSSGTAPTGGNPIFTHFHPFLMHDFSRDGRCEANSLPTCAWGLIGEDGNEKPAWAEFRNQGSALNASDSDPVRDCP